MQERIGTEFLHDAHVHREGPGLVLGDEVERFRRKPAMTVGASAASAVEAARVSGMRARPRTAVPSSSRNSAMFMPGEPMKPATKTLAGSW